MDVDTLLTRQMELHTTTRRPPKNADQLLQLRETLVEYKRFFRKLQDLTTELGSDRVTVFQCLMHISVGGAVKFDRQAQNGGMPMHQAKVLARATAIELEPHIRERVPHEELMVYVGLSKDLRSTLRVKVEDENDLKTVQKSVEDSVEYLEFIHSHSKGDPQKMFAFYMIEDGPSLLQMIDDCNGVEREGSPVSASLSLSQGSVPSSMLVQEWNPKAPLPPLDQFLQAVKQQMDLVQDKSVHASERVVAAQDVHDWITQLPDESFRELFLDVCEVLAEPLAALCCDKRSSLSRITCDTMVLLSFRGRTLECAPNTVTTSTSSNSSIGNRYAQVLTVWTTALLKGIYVTVTAISSGTDLAVRRLILQNHGPMAIVNPVMDALKNGKQTELRRKCLGYLALCVAAAEAHSIGGGNAFASSLIPIAEEFVEMGDSPSRKMARALCAVLRGLTLCQVTINNPKVQQLIDKEMELLQPHFATPGSLETKLFGAGDFICSLSSTGSVSLSSTYKSAMGGTRDGSFNFNASRDGSPSASLAKQGGENPRTFNNVGRLSETHPGPSSSRTKRTLFRKGDFCVEEGNSEKNNENDVSERGGGRAPPTKAGEPTGPKQSPTSSRRMMWKNHMLLRGDNCEQGNDKTFDGDKEESSPIIERISAASARGEVEDQREGGQQVLPSSSSYVHNRSPRTGQTKGGVVPATTILIPGGVVAEFSPPRVEEELVI